MSTRVIGVALGAVLAYLVTKGLNPDFNLQDLIATYAQR